jgi:hypothetical protein
MKTSGLTNAALDWAVAKCEGVDDYIVNESFMTRWSDDECEDGVDYHYSTDWSQGGPIIEREKITLEWTGEDWMAYIKHDDEFFGPTPLIAAMRCYVASKLGQNVDIPKELT